MTRQINFFRRNFVFCENGKKCSVIEKRDSYKGKNRWVVIDDKGKDLGKYQVVYEKTS